MVEIVVVVVVRIEAESFLLLSVENRYRHVAALLAALQHLLPQPVALRLEDRFGVDLSAVDHDGKEAEDATVFSSDDGDGLSGFHPLSHVDKVLRVIGVDGLEAVVVPDDDGVAILLCVAGEAYGSIEHGFYRVAFGRRYLKGTVFGRCFAYR